jgi:hypothetical protein
VQELLKLGDPFIFGVLIPLGVLLLVALVPYITSHQLSPAELGSWFPRGGRSAQVFVAVLAVIILLLTFLALLT